MSRNHHDLKKAKRRNPAPDRLPHAEDMERGVLSCILLSPRECLPKVVQRFHGQSPWHSLVHQTVFCAMVSVGAESLDVLSLHGYLKDNAELDQVGGIGYLNQIQDAAPSAANLSYYLDIVWEKYELRRRIQLCTDIVGRIHAHTGDSNGLLDEVDRDLGQLAKRGPATDDWGTRLAACAFDFARQPPPFVPVYSLCGHPTCTSGNLTSIVSQAKTGKSAVVGAMLGSTMVDDFCDTVPDLLGFKSANPANKAVIHFDTEQSPYDAWHVVARAVRRAGVSSPPAWLISYCLTGMLPRDAWKAVQEGIRRASEQFKVHSILIDGVGDLVHDVNDAGECNDFVAALHGLAIANDCPIIGVLHFNPDSAKARGHLGSQLERKAESNLRLDKEDECTVLWSNKQRRSAIDRNSGPRFRWDDQAKMHISIETRSEARRDGKAQAEIPYRDDVFGQRQAMRYNEIVSALETTVKCSPRTAERRVEKWRKLSIIRKTVANLWEKAD